MQSKPKLSTSELSKAINKRFQVVFFLNDGGEIAHDFDSIFDAIGHTRKYMFNLSAWKTVIIFDAFPDDGEGCDIIYEASNPENLRYLNSQPNLSRK